MVTSASPANRWFPIGAVLLSAAVLAAFEAWEDFVKPVGYGEECFLVGEGIPVYNHREFNWAKLLVVFVISSLIIGATLKISSVLTPEAPVRRQRLPEELIWPVNPPAPTPDAESQSS